ncbi:hypothetical protein CEV33_4895 [Brucella grignonensis]|uniref:Uncharacterized protein n=1 Tax=Brucella grignonensis TaxID=94627 RepID=A0A256FS22_9HYPH|nr:hypothetical protein CEV33_4895 [Brucella grignonensis]
MEAALDAYDRGYCFRGDLRSALLGEIKEGYRHGLEPDSLLACAVDRQVDVAGLFADMRARRHISFANALAVRKIPSTGPNSAGMATAAIVAALIGTNCL